MTKTDTLLLYSGGIDSVQALYARAKAGLPTRVHHVVLLNWERRAQYEKAAVRSTLAWIEKRYPGMVEYTESGFDYGDLKYIVRDHNIWGLVAGIILANPKNAHLTKVLRTFHRDSVKGGLESPAGRAAERGWRESIDRLTVKRDEPVEFTYPQIEMAKGDIMAAMPAGLLELTWYCRRPRGGRPCHECHTCKQVDAVVAGEPLEPLDGQGASETVKAEVDDTADTPEVKRPNRSHSRADWATYAEAIGLDVEGLTKAQIIAAVEAL